MSPQGCTVRADVDWYNVSNVFISTSSSGTVNVPPMTPVFLNLTGITAPAGAAWAYPHPTLVSSPATGTQLYFDRARLSPAGFLVPYEPDIEIIEDIQYLFNDIVITRNVDQATYRARSVASRAKYYPRVYPRTIYSSVDDANAVVNCANFLLSNFSSPLLRVTRVTVDAAENPEAWPFVLSAGIGDNVSFTRTPLGGAVVTGSFLILSIEPDLARDKARFTYVLAPLPVSPFSFVGFTQTTTAANGGTSATIAVPAGVQNGDFLVLMAATWTSSGGWTTPAGWTQIYNQALANAAWLTGWPAASRPATT
jgi:hypothetical protein